MQIFWADAYIQDDRDSDAFDDNASSHREGNNFWNEHTVKLRLARLLWLMVCSTFGPKLTG